MSVPVKYTPAAFDKDTSTKIFTSKTLPQYAKYIKDQKTQNNLVQKFKFKFDCSSDFVLTRSQQLVLDAIDSTLPSKSQGGKKINFGIFGKAGVGKSALINVIRKRYERKKLNVQILGPTGYCVSQYKGAQTIHSFFGLGINSNFESLILDPIRKGLVRSVQKIDLIIIDELGLVDTFLFQYINVRLQVLRQSENLFGGISIIVIFDPLQLPCIKSNSLWSDQSEVESEFGREGLRVFKQFQFFNLVENVRQKDDVRFQNILENFRHKTVTQGDIDALNERTISNLDTEYSRAFCMRQIKNAMNITLEL
jgi:hypothetical protein